MTEATNQVDAAQAAQEKPQVVYFLPDKVYQAAKWLAVLVLPAAATFYSAVSPYWAWPATEGVVVTLSASSALLGTLIGISAATRQGVR
jgi:hypothetical protein